MKIEIIIDNNMECRHYICSSYEEAINILYDQKIQQIKSKPATGRCSKCVYLRETCGQTDKDGKCWKYRRDPPDGGYYG